MPFNGSGGFDPLSPPTYPAVPAETIFAAKFNSVIGDILTGLGQTVTRNGQSPATANLPMGGFKHTGVGDATASGQYIAWGQDATLGALLASSVTLVSGGAVEGGTFTPTITAIANLSAQSVTKAFYFRLGAYVLAGYLCSLTPSSAGGGVQFYLSLPVSSALAAASDALGVIGGDNTSLPICGAVVGEPSSDKLDCRVNCAQTGAFNGVVLALYKIL
jgi:hypothetical protein